MRRAEITLCQEKLRTYFRYDAANGNLIWIMRGKRARMFGKVAGIAGQNGYINIKIDNRTWLAHIVIWIFHNGNIQSRDMEIDHIDRNKHNNRIENLRLVTHQENMLNIAPRFGVVPSHAITDLNLISEIKKAVGTKRALAQRFGVCAATVVNIQNERGRYAVLAKETNKVSP